MLWILICAAVFIAAFVMWEGISPELPELLRLPQEQAAQSAYGSQPASTPQATIGPTHWRVLSDARNVRASREFRTPIRAGAQVYYPPVLHLSCYDGQLHAWLETGLRAQEGPPGRVTVRINGGPTETWTAREGTVLVAPDPKRLLETLIGSPELTLTVAFRDAPEQTLRLRTNGIADLSPRLTGCKASSAQ